jgi:AraC-like DNA-binding protein
LNDGTGRVIESLSGVRMTWAHRIQLTADDAVFSGQEAALMRELVNTGSWPESWSVDTEVEHVSMHEQAQLLQRMSPELACAVADKFGLLDFGSAGAAVLASANLSGAVRVMNSFAPLLNLRHVLKLSVAKDDVVITLRPHTQDVHGGWDAVLCVDIAKVARFLRDLLTEGRLGSLSDRPSDLPREPGPAVASVTGMLCISNRDKQIRISKASLRQKQPIEVKTDPNTYLKVCRRMMHRLREHALCNSVRRMLFLCPEAVPSVAEMAAKQRMSARTFRRYLANQNTTFVQILDEVRFELAVRYLKDRDLTTELIAQKLGYSEGANFRAAFRRWTGSSPRNFNVRSADVRVGTKWRVGLGDGGHTQCP